MTQKFAWHRVAKHCMEKELAEHSMLEAPMKTGSRITTIHNPDKPTNHLSLSDANQPARDDASNEVSDV